MLSPKHIPSRKDGRASSIWSIDSGYGSGLHEDCKLGLSLNPRDAFSGSASQTGPPQPIRIGIERLAKSQFADNVFMKEEEIVAEPTTPRLRLCTNISVPSSPEPISPASPSEVRRSHARKAASKLPSQAIARLTAWLDANRHHPYPSAEAKQALAEACSITVKQVTTWFTNTRQRQFKSQENNGGVGNDYSQTSTQTARKGKKKDYSRSNGASPIEGFLSPPRLSPCASISEQSSGEGDNWQCTFCRVALTAKSWRRHEETQHYPKFQWTCLAFGPRITLPSCTSTICAFCDLENPDDDHFRLFHRVGDCMCKPEGERTFGRPDHLQQHARNFHKCVNPLTELVREAWRKDGPGKIAAGSWTCGFCQEVLSDWDTRATHIAGHFKAGLTIAQWREGRVSPLTLLQEPNKSEESVTLDSFTGMDAAFAGPSHYRSPPTSHARIDSVQHLLVAQNIPSTTFMPGSAAAATINIDPFCVYGNPVDTFDPSITYNLPVNIVSGPGPDPDQHANSMSAEFGFVGVDDYGNPIYDFSMFPAW